MCGPFVVLPISLPLSIAGYLDDNTSAWLAGHDVMKIIAVLPF